MTELAKKSDSPQIISFFLSTFRDSFPAISTNGMMTSEGSEASICISNCEAWGNTVSRSPRIGDTANPGSEVTTDSE